MTNFYLDAEKMHDFRTMDKREFLSFYSYITEQEYNNTLRIERSVDIRALWKQTLNETRDTSEIFDVFCEKIDKKYQNDDTNTYIRILWGAQDCDFELVDELLDLGYRFDIKYYTTIECDTPDCLVVVALHDKYLKQ